MNMLDYPFIETGNYFCTWETQEKVAKIKNIEGNNLQEKQRNAMDDAQLFAENSLYHPIPEKYRSSIYFLLDDGWDVSYNTDAEKSKAMFGSLILDEMKFPNYGNTPTQRLKTLSEKIKDMGYCGLGLWICPQMANEKEEVSLEETEKYWCERATWSNEAGIKYWKIDWGKHGFNRDYLEMMVKCARKCAPDLLIENAYLQLPFGGTTGPEHPITAKMTNLFEISDYFRTYDVAEPFVDVSTLCRLDALLSKTNKSNFALGAKGYINIESSPLIAAGLGCNLGIMFPGGNVNACLSWQRVAPPMSIFEVEYDKSEIRLTDYKYGDCKPISWSHFLDVDYSISAPAVTARGTKLPKVEEMDTPPYIMASCHPKTKAYAVSSLHRVIDPNNKYISLADVTIYPDEMKAPIGIFGYYKTLCVEFSDTIPQKVKVFAQCLLDDEAFEVTDKVIIKNKQIILDGKFLRRWGRSSKAVGFGEDPALVLKVVT